MPVVITDEPWVPAQETFITGPEMRGFAAGRPSRKRAREVEEHGLEDDEMVDEHEVERLRKASRPTYKQVVGKASGRAWKQPAKQRAASFMKAQTGGTKSWDDRMKEKAAKKAFQEAMKEKADEARADRKAEHQRRAAKKATEGGEHQAHGDHQGGGHQPENHRETREDAQGDQEAEGAQDVRTHTGARRGRGDVGIARSIYPSREQSTTLDT